MSDYNRPPLRKSGACTSARYLVYFHSPRKMWNFSNFSFSACNLKILKIITRNWYQHLRTLGHHTKGTTRPHAWTIIIYHANIHKCQLVTLTGCIKENQGCIPRLFPQSTLSQTSHFLPFPGSLDTSRSTPRWWSTKMWNFSNCSLSACNLQIWTM